MKKILTNKTVLLLAACALFLVGCGTSSNNGGDPPADGSSNWNEMVWNQDNWS